MKPVSIIFERNIFDNTVFSKIIIIIIELESDSDTNCNWSAQYSYQMFATRTGGLENKGTSGDHPNYSIVDIGQDTEKSPGDL